MKTQIFEFCFYEVHKKMIEVAWLDITGQVFLHGSFENSPEGNQRLWEKYLRLSTIKVAIEPTDIYWRAVYKFCLKLINAMIFNSATSKLKTRPKTYIKDAIGIAYCLRADIFLLFQFCTAEK